MNNQALIRLGVPQGDALKLCYEHMRRLFARGLDREQVEADIFNIVANPPAFFADELRAPLARAIYLPAFTPRAELPLRRLCSHRSAEETDALPRGAFAPWRQWDDGPRRRKGIEEVGGWASKEAEAVKQMANACALPSRPSANPHFSPPPPRRCAPVHQPPLPPRLSLPSGAGTLMPDALSCPLPTPAIPFRSSVGYGLPIVLGQFDPKLVKMCQPATAPKTDHRGGQLRYGAPRSEFVQSQSSAPRSRLRMPKTVDGRYGALFRWKYSG